MVFKPLCCLQGNRATKARKSTKYSSLENEAGEIERADTGRHCPDPQPAAMEVASPAPAASPSAGVCSSSRAVVVLSWKLRTSRSMWQSCLAAGWGGHPLLGRDRTRLRESCKEEKASPHLLVTSVEFWVLLRAVMQWTAQRAAGKIISKQVSACYIKTIRGNFLLFLAALPVAPGRG